MDQVTHDLRSGTRAKPIESIVRSEGSQNNPALAVACAILALTIVACSSFDRYDQKGGPTIASEIEAATGSGVKDVSYTLGDYLDPATVVILMNAGATSRDADEIICRVVAPIVASGDPPTGFSVSVFDEASTTMLASDADACPTASPPG